MKDIFGYEKNTKHKGAIASSEFASITIGSKQSLVQSLSGQYGQSIDEVMEIGSSTTFFVPGRSRGTLSAAKLVGAGGFFDGWTDSDCGYIEPISLTIKGGRCGYSGSGGLKFGSGILESVSFSMSAQQLQISQSAQIRISSVQVV